MKIKGGVVPTVEHGVMLNAMADLLRPMVTDPQADPVVDHLKALMDANPEFVSGLEWFAGESPNPAWIICGGVVGYLLIQAQIEVEELRRLEAVCAEQTGTSAPAL